MSEREIIYPLFPRQNQFQIPQAKSKLNTNENCTMAFTSNCVQHFDVPEIDAK